MLKLIDRTSSLNTRLNVPVKFGNIKTTAVKPEAMDGSFMRDLFVKIARMDTRSDHTAPDNGPVPSTESQRNLANYLKPIMEKVGLQNVGVDAQGIVSGILPSNMTEDNIPTIALLAHLDLAHDAPTAGITPLIHDYTGGDITLPKDGTVIPEKDLQHHMGHDIITSSGDTLLGGDDKAGIVEILDTVQYFEKHPELLRPHIKVAFTPDEEIGRMLTFLDLGTLGADAAYTLDGGPPQEINYETFNAHSVKVSFETKDTTQKARAFAEFIHHLPKTESPETTEGYEGYLHPMDGMGISVENSSLTLTVKTPVALAHIERAVDEVKQAVQQDYAKNPSLDRLDITLKETEKADQYQLSIKGVNIHAGYAKNEMINGVRLLGDVIHRMFTSSQTLSEKELEASITIDTFGDSSAADALHPLHLLVRDFDYNESLRKVERLKTMANTVNDRFGFVRATSSESYQNMKNYIEAEDPNVINFAEEGITRTSGKAVVKLPIRGGVDGAKLSERGLPTPNLPAGENNIHSKKEFVSIQDMQACAANIVNTLIVLGESLQKK